MNKFNNTFILLLKSNIQKYKNFNKNIYMQKLEKIKIKIGENERKCPYCQKILSSLLNYHKHIQKSICRKEKINTCNLCNKYFSRKSNYDYHINNKVCNKNNNIIDNYVIDNNMNNQDNIIYDNNEIQYIDDNKVYINNDKKQDKNILNKIYLEEYRKIIREKIYENLINKDIEQIAEKNNIHKYKKVKISNIFKRQCWNHWIGEDIGKIICPVCKLTYITQLNFSCAHIISESKGGKLELDNVRPVCGGCNSSVYTNDLTSFINN